MKGDAPTHNIICCREGENTWHEIGVAWEDESGKLRLSFPPTTLIDREFLETHTIRVSPRKRGSKSEAG